MVNSDRYGDSATPEEYTEHAAGIVARALEETSLVEIREVQANGLNQIHLLCRVRKENEKEVTHTIVDRILSVTDPLSDVNVFVGKQLLRKNGRMCYAWVFSFASEDLDRLVELVCGAIDDAVPKRRIEVTESPLMGPGSPQSTGPGSKGASPLRAS